MNPLFAAHLIADFLLQPTWMVELKRRRITGVVMHSLIHLVVMSILLLPLGTTSFLILVLIALSHGLIDYAKIHHASKAYRCKEFISDQFAHLIVLIAASAILPSPLSLWHSESFKGILILLIFFSFSLGWFNLSYIAKAQEHYKKVLLMLIVTFLLFTLSSKLLAASPCPLL